MEVVISRQVKINIGVIYVETFSRLSTILELHGCDRKVSIDLQLFTKCYLWTSHRSGCAVHSTRYVQYENVTACSTRHSIWSASEVSVSINQLQPHHRSEIGSSGWVNLGGLVVSVGSWCGTTFPSGPWWWVTTTIFMYDPDSHINSPWIASLSIDKLGRAPSWFLCAWMPGRGTALIITDGLGRPSACEHLGACSYSQSVCTSWSSMN